MKGMSLIFFVVILVSMCTLTIAGCDPQRQPTNSNDSPTRGQERPAQTSETSNAMPVTTQEQYDFTNVDRLLERAPPQLGGCALVLIQDGKIVYRKAFGRYKVDRVVPVASASKWLSGALIMTLVDEGKLSLDDPVSKYLPEFAGGKAGITARIARP